jgi:hypothetical protein
VEHHDPERDERWRLQRHGELRLVDVVGGVDRRGTDRRQRRVVLLDRFGTVRFTNASAVKDGQAVTPSAAGALAVTMVNNKTGVTLATPIGAWCRWRELHRDAGVEARRPRARRP